MTKTIFWTALIGSTVAAMIIPATAQSPTSPPPASTVSSPKNAPAPVGSPKKKATPSASGIAGNWSGQLTQIGREKPYKVELSITAKGAETKYPDLDCSGKLRRVGRSKSYAFFVEIITAGRADKGGHCPDGTITVARQGDGLALNWFGIVQNSTVVAYGTLSKR
jgi:hypothetical protein